MDLVLRTHWSIWDCMRFAFSSNLRSFLCNPISASFCRHLNSHHIDMASFLGRKFCTSMYRIHHQRRYELHYIRLSAFHGLHFGYNSSVSSILYPFSPVSFENLYLMFANQAICSMALAWMTSFFLHTRLYCTMGWDTGTR